MRAIDLFAGWGGFTLMYAQEAYSYMTGAAVETARPFVLLRPKMYPDGDQWCALYGENPQEGVVGFGASPAKAAEAFDAAWYAVLPSHKLSRENEQ